MSKNIYLPFIAVLFFSCSNYLPYSAGSRAKSITDIPLKQSAENVDCFFNNQTPAKPFYKVSIVEVTAGSNSSYDELIISLKNKAKIEGYDGIMILDKQQETIYESAGVSHRYEQVASTYQKLSAIGIKYAENINYLDTIVKSTAFEFGENSHRNNAIVRFDFYGNQIAGGDIALNNFYIDSIEVFDIDKHLASKVKGWKYMTDNTNTPGIVSAFKNEINEIPVASAKISENDPSKFYYKIFNPVTSKKSKYVLKFEKDNKGRIAKKTLFQKDKIVWVEEIYFDKNITTGCKRYRVRNGKQETIFTATNQFYSVNDLPKPL